MIEIRNPIDDVRRCNVCSSKNDVKEIAFIQDNSGSVVALCADCRKELFYKLKGCEEE